MFKYERETGPKLLHATMSVHLRRHRLLLATVATLLVALAATGWLLLNPDGATKSVRLSRARRAYEAGKFSESTAAFKKIVSRDPGNWQARSGLALALAAQGHNPEAIGQYQAIVAKNPRDDATLYRLAALERIIGEPKDSERHLQKALNLAPDNVSYLDEMARTKLALGQAGTAAKLWGSVLKKPGVSNESRRELLVLQAQAYEAAGEHPEAVNALRKALRLDPSDEVLQVRLQSFE